MSKVIKTNQKALEQWAKKQVNEFVHQFSDAQKAYDTTANHILKIWYGASCNWTELPKMVSNHIKYTIGAFKEKDRFIITVMNPKTGAFGKAVIAEKDYELFSWIYGLALAYARLKNEDVYILEDEITMDKVTVGQHFLWKECEWVMTFTSYDSKNKYHHYILYNITERYVRDKASSRTRQDKVKLI